MKNGLVRQPVRSFPICTHIRIRDIHGQIILTYEKMDLFAYLYAHYQFVRTLRIEIHRHIILAYEKWTCSPTFSTHLSNLFAYQEKQTRYEKWTTIRIMLFAHFSDNTWFFFQTLSCWFFFSWYEKTKVEWYVQVSGHTHLEKRWYTLCTFSFFAFIYYFRVV